MNLLALVRAALEALAAYYQSAAIRERAGLRKELHNLRHEIIAAADAGHTGRLAELQDHYTDASADYQALRPAARAGSG